MLLTHATRGQQFDRRASTYSAFVDAANDFSKRNNTSTRPNNQLLPYFNGLTVKVKNVSGSSCDIFSILQLQIDSSVIDFATYLTAYIFNETVIEGDTPGVGASVGDPRAPVCVLLQPAIDDQIVDALVYGITTCIVDIDDTNHKYAIVQSSRSNLKSSQCGQFRILDREDDGSTGNTQYCKVSLDYSSPLRAKAEIDNGGAITANGSGLVTFVNGTTKETTDKVTAHYNWMTAGAASLADGTEVIIEYFPTESKWIIVAADCQ